MSKFKKGDIVARISYHKDVLFKIVKIIRASNRKEIIILKGITERIEADSPPEDLEIIDKRTVEAKIKRLEDKMYKRIEECIKDPKYCFCKAKKMFYWKNENRSSRFIYTGKILHLDGDKRYAEKSVKYYRSLGLNAVVKNIPENKQAQIVKSLLERYQPDVLVITGHDRYDKKRNRF